MKITISNESLKMTLHVPDGAKGYYRGTRFDWAGVFESIEYRGCNYAEPWFESYSPTMHDAVCGPAEEFGPIGFDEAAPGGRFLKIGVGMLERMDDGPYDRFRLHPIAEAGERTVSQSEDSVIFTHRLESPSGYGYEYSKEIHITGKDSFRISHSLKNIGTIGLRTDVYNHNFFTLGLLETGPGRTLDFPFSPDGDWRAEYSEVGFSDKGIRFTRTLREGESVFTGNLHQAAPAPSGCIPAILEPVCSPNAFELCESATGRGVVASCSEPMTRAVFWANHRIACIEPYIDVSLELGHEFRFHIDYKLLSLQD